MTQEQPATSELTERATRDLRLAQDADAEARLKVLEDLYRQLESELERDVGQASPPRR